MQVRHWPSEVSFSFQVDYIYVKKPATVLRTCSGDQTERISGSLEQLGCLRGMAKALQKKKSAEARSLPTDEKSLFCFLLPYKHVVSWYPNCAGHGNALVCL